MIDFEIEKAEVPTAKIKVIGIGGAGGNCINSMINTIENIEFIAANTDAQALNLCKAHHKVQLGLKSTKGLGTGANPELGKRAAEEDLSKVMDFVEDADIVFLTAGMGGGTGSGAVPVIARALKEKNILSIAVVTKPFIFEGKRRARVAQEAIELLKKEVDTLLIIPNQKLLEVVDQSVSMIDAFAMINDILNQSVKGIADIIAKPGHINVDFADVRTIMKDMGLAVMGTGRATGPDRALDAAMQAISSPLLENMSIEGAKGVLLNISGGRNLGLHEIGVASAVIAEQADQDASIIVGSVIDDALKDEVIITVIATGFDLVKEQPVVAPKVEAIALKEKEIKKEPVKESMVQVKGTAVLDREELKKVEPKKEESRFDVLDPNDLDIPSFLRNKEHSKSSDE